MSSWRAPSLPSVRIDRRRALYALLGACLTHPYRVAADPQGTAPQPLIHVPLVFHVVVDASAQPIVPPAFVTRAVDSANAIFAPARITFTHTLGTPLPSRHAALVTRADRTSLLGSVRGPGVHCMVVAELGDVDEPGRVRRGVHWVMPHARRPHAVIVSAIAEARVLAHELGHYLGLRAHDDRPGNVMSYAWGETLPVFDARQIARLRTTASTMRAQREI